MTPAAELVLDRPETASVGLPLTPSVDVAQTASVGLRPLPIAPRLGVVPAPARPAECNSIIARPRLFEQLERGARVALVSAPPGSGKTSLLRSWIRETGRESVAAWLPLGRGERDPHHFWHSLRDAVRATEPGFAVLSEASPVADRDGGAPVEALLADLNRLDRRLWLIIDDLNELRAPETSRQFELLLAHSPANLRFALSTRGGLPVGLHRLRLEGELTELRGADLRFSLEEARALFEASGVQIPESALSVLVERTEGWAAGLRLAAISLSRHADPERFVTEFSGSERTVSEYLLAEVMERLPAEVRALLLRTSVLDRVSGPLADHLTGGLGSERVLQELEDANAFVTSLDAQRSCFRYHHLFADLLRLELRRAAPESPGELHRAAANWYEQAGQLVKATEHAQAARDWPQASRLVTAGSLDLIFDGRSSEVCELLRAFPGDAVAADPNLALVFATARLLDGDHEESAAYVQLAERNLDAVPEDRQRHFDLVMAEVRLALARWQGDVTTVIELIPVVEAALAAQPAGGRTLGDALRAVAFLNLGAAELWSSRVDDARRHLDDALTLARRAGRPWLEVSCLGHLGMARPLTGSPFVAGLELAEAAVRTAEDHGTGEDPVCVTGLAAGAHALVWLGRLDEAERWLERAERTLHPNGEPGTELLVRHAQGLLLLARGRSPEALAAFGAAGRMQTMLADEHAFSVVARAGVLRTQVRMGQLDAARTGIGETREEDRDTAEMRIAAAVLHLADGDPARAIDTLAAVIDGVAPTIHGSSVATEARVLDAIARDELGDRHGAEVALESALEMAEPEGILLPFILSPVRDILERLPRHRTAHAALRQTILDVLAGAAPVVEALPVAMRDELSEAELRVVRYLPSNLRAPEIAAELFVSTNTVRTHIRHIYAKLDAHGRAEAVDRARALGLLAPTHRLR